MGRHSWRRVAGHDAFGVVFRVHLRVETAHDAVVGVRVEAAVSVASRAFLQAARDDVVDSIVVDENVVRRFRLIDESIEPSGAGTETEEAALVGTMSVDR